MTFLRRAELLDITQITSYESSVGMHIVLSPQFAVPSVHGFDLSSRPILLILEIRTAFSCE